MDPSAVSVAEIGRFESKNDEGNNFCLFLLLKDFIVEKTLLTQPNYTATVTDAAGFTLIEL